MAKDSEFLFSIAENVKDSLGEDDYLRIKAIAEKQERLEAAMARSDTFRWAVEGVTR